MRCATLPEAAAIRSRETRRTLNLALVYQGPLTRAWACHVSDGLAQGIGKPSVHCTEWPIDKLQEGTVVAEGATALAQADGIIIALQETERLPGVFYLWVNLWLQNRHGRPGSLIALVGTAKEPSPEPTELRSYLHAIASQGRFEFLLKECACPVEPPQVLRDDRLEWAKAV